MLHEELEILEPNIIVAMGKSDNYDCLKEMFLNDGYEIVGDWYRGEYVRRIRLSKSNRILHLYGVSHPMSFGWKVSDVLGELCLDRHLFLQRPITT